MAIQLQLEGTGGLCNAACNFCPLTDRSYYKNGRGVGTMSMDLYRKLIDEAATIPEIREICITGLSETLLDKHLVERIAYARKVLGPEMLIDFYTNGLALTPAKYQECLDAGIGCVTISLNAVTPEQHDNVMHMGLKAYDRICANIDAAIATPGRTAIEVKAVVDGEHFTREHSKQFYSRWGHRSIGGFGQVIIASNWAGQMPTVGEFDNNLCCPRAISQIYVLFDGIATACCLDPLGLIAREITGHPDGFGNLNTSTIREVYNSPKYVEFRETHDKNQASKIRACSVCTRV